MWQDRLHHVHSLCSWHAVLTAEHVSSRRKIESYCNQVDVCRSIRLLSQRKKKLKRKEKDGPN